MFFTGEYTPGLSLLIITIFPDLKKTAINLLSREN
jgi:hypothetical protein